MKRDLLVHIPEHHPALRRLKKEIYYKHIYHTIAIEGNTLNLHQTRAIVETRMTIAGKSISEHSEVCLIIYCEYLQRQIKVAHLNNTCQCIIVEHDCQIL